jgi:hypothetical protein
MLCVANVNLPDWPEGTARDVDPSIEKTRGLLRAGFIVPLVKRPAARASEPPAATESSEDGDQVAEKPKSRQQRARAGESTG